VAESLLDDHADTIEGSTPVTVSEAVTGRIDNDNDSDFFVFEAAEGQGYQIDVLQTGSSDPILALYDSTYEQIAYNDDYNGLAPRLVWQAIKSEPAYIEVTAYSTGSYTLRISAVEIKDDHANTDAGATAVTVGEGTAGRIHYSGDADVFQFEAAAGTIYNIEIVLGTLEDSMLELRDSAWEVIATNDDSVDGLDSRLGWRARLPETYNVVVTGYGQGSYLLTVKTVEDDHGDFREEATSIEGGEYVSSSIDHANDIDYFVFEATQGQAYQIEVVGLDVSLQLRDKQGVIIAEAHQGTLAEVARIDWGAPRSDTYWIAVSPYYYIGSYVLALEEIVPVSQQAAADFTPVVDWLLMGDAERTPSGSVMLTPGKTSQVGALFYSQPMTSANFRVEFSFEITGEGTRADGIVLVAARSLPGHERVKRSGGGGRLGNDLFTQAIAVEFDTYNNVWDTSDSHVGLSLMGDVTGYDHPLALAATELDLDLRNSGVYQAEVVLATGQVEVYLSHFEQGIQRELVLSTTIPDTVPMEDYLEEYYIGLVAATGETTDRHFIHEVRLEVDKVAVSQTTPTLQEYADRFAGDPGAIYVGDINQLVGPAPTVDQGDFDGNVPLGALQRHLWIYESRFYEELLEKARLADPTPMTYDGEPITIQHVCINRDLLPCRLMETYLAPNLVKRTNGKLRFTFSSFPELGVSGPDVLSLVTDGVLDSATVYAGYAGGQIPHIDIQNLWGVYSSREQEFEASQAIIKDIEELVLAETGGVIMNHNWYAGNDQFFFCRDKLDSLEDFRGKRIRSHSTPLSDWISGMGATAQFVAFAEVYTALERGILDCGVTGADPAYGQRWYEVTDYMIGPLLSLPFHSNVVSNAVWNSIPADLQQILLEEAAKSELEALRLAAIQNEIGLIKNTTERGGGQYAMQFLPFSDEVNSRNLNTVVMEHVVPGWVNRVGDTNHPIIADTFNRKLGPIVGLRIETDGRVIRVPQQAHSVGTTIDHERELTASTVSQTLLANLAKQAEEGLVEITAYKPGSNRFTAGIGFIFATDGSTAFVVTYGPLIEFESETASPIEVRVNKANTYQGTVLRYDSDRYFGVLSICCDDNFAALELETSGSPQTGTQVIAIGYPEYLSRASSGCDVRSCATATAGFIQSLEWNRPGMFAHDAHLNSEYFGGPLVSTEGKTWGVNVGLSSPEGFLYTVSHETINELLSNLAE